MPSSQCSSGRLSTFVGIIMMELLKCPFCAQEAEVDFLKSKNYCMYWVECNSCHARTPNYELSSKTAVSHWNRRTTPL